MLNTMCFDCKKLNNGCNGTTCQTWTGCIYKEKAEISVIEGIKEEVRKNLTAHGYKEEQLDFINDIISVVRPGVVMIKEKICGEYTGKLTEMYL